MSSATTVGHDLRKWPSAHRFRAFANEDEVYPDRLMSAS
jgi:hypothetical protein